MTQSIIVVGAGQAAIAFAAKMRALDPDIAITMVGDEPHLPYQRPPLSKKYVMGEMTVDRLALRSPDWYEQHDITCITGIRAETIDPEAKTLTLFDGKCLSWDYLVLATGSRPRSLPSTMGGDLEGVYVIRSIADADAIRDEFQAGKKALVVGGGYIGLEAAAVAASIGVEVTLIEMADRILQRVAASETSDFFRTLHTANGVSIREATGLETLIGKDGRVVGARLANGEEIAVDFVLAGIGIMTNSELAEQAGIAIDNGISVDLHGETSISGIYACGDCASFDFNGTRLRLESVQNAIDQAENIAINIDAECNGTAVSKDIDYRPIPWFWSDQYDTKLQIAGLNIGYDTTVVRPGAREGTQSVWYFKEGAFVAVDAMDDPRAYMVGKKLLEMGKTISPSQVADPETDLKALLKG